MKNGDMPAAPCEMYFESRVVDQVLGFKKTRRLHECPGLTKRELIAAMAMQGLLANKTIEASISSDEAIYLVGDLAVSYADSLLKWLEKQQ